jgi:tRNA pseudouridine55 synthase
LIFQNIYKNPGNKDINSEKQPSSDMSSVFSGILVIDKPENITSAGVTNRLKRISGVQKAGHTGTLDPFASGVLVCTLNQATRLSRFFLSGEKKYRATMVLGIETDTQDATGKILNIVPVEGISGTDIHQAAKHFEGDIHQVPPVFSALKHKGVPLYAYARKGCPVVKPARLVSIAYIHVMDIKLPEVSVEVSCSSGTYIRTLCADIGKALGCGGHLKTLRRIESCGFSIHETIPLHAIESCSSMDALKNNIVPMSDSLWNMRAYVAGKDLIDKIRYGKVLEIEDICLNVDEGADRFIKLVSENGHLLAVVERSENRETYNYCCVFLNP